MFFKRLSRDQAVAVKESLYESIPITGTILSGSYLTYPNETNILKFTASHGLFESVYDYPYASSSANHIFDITYGHRSGSTTPFSGAPVTQSAQKYRVYQEMAQTLLGFDVTGNVKNFVVSGTTVADSLMFVNFSRILTKDGIKVGSLTASVGTASYLTPFAGTLSQLSDNPSVTVDSVKADSPAGQYWYVYTGSTYTEADKVGLVFYQQGVLALDLSRALFNSCSYSGAAGVNPTNAYLSGANLQSTGTITEISDGFRRYVQNLQFQNTVQVNSTIYTCQVGMNEFNYSSNPTYTSGSKIVVKSNPFDNNTTYITTVGLYSADGDLTAIAKLSEPIKKTQSDSLNIRIRLDY